MSERQGKFEVTGKELHIAVSHSSQNEVESPNKDTNPKKEQNQTDFQTTMEISKDIKGIMNENLKNVEETSYYNSDVTREKKLRRIPLKYSKIVKTPSGDKKNFIPDQTEFAVYFIERTSPKGDTLDYDSDRNSFVFIVFTITFCMLVITACSGYLAAIQAREFLIKYGLFLAAAASFVLLAVTCAMSCCSACLRTAPCAYVLLVIAVICMSTIVAVMSCLLKTRVIHLAVIATTVTVAICMCLACTSIDFTKCIFFVIVVSVAILAVSIIVLVIKLFTDWDLTLLQIAILFVSTITTVVMIIIQLQMILGGKSVELGEDEHALAAFMLYTSIMQLFFSIVEIIVQSSDL